MRRHKEVSIFNETGTRLKSGFLKNSIMSAWKRYFPSYRGYANLVFVGDRRIRALNKRYLKKDSPTDVIAFFYTKPPEVSGDIFISVPQAKRQCRRAHSLNRELRLLAVHGFLHLVGYTDYTEKEKTKMWRLQDEIIGWLDKK